MNKINKRNVQDIYALTPMQEGMLFHYLNTPGNELYFEQLTLSLGGEIDFRVFKEAWNVVAESNEVLRTVFRWEGAANPVQIVLTHVEPRVEWVEFPNDGSDREKWLEGIKAADRKRGFDLRKAYVPFRVTLCKLETGQYVSMISNFHILYDGWSNGIILKEFFTAYNVLSKGESYRPPVKGAFKDFIRWIRDRENQTLEVFWKGYLKGIDTQTELPVKKKGKESSGCGRYCGRFDEKLKAGLENFVKERRLTPAALLYSAWGVLLQTYNRTGDVLFGTTVSGRSAKVEGIEHIAGLFIVTLPLRIREIPGEKTVDFLYRVDRGLKEREAYEHTSLVDIKSYSDITGGGELFDTILVIENYPLDTRFMPRGGELPFSVESYEIVEATHYDLTVTISTVPHMEIVFSYKRGVLDTGIAAMLFRHFNRIVGGMLSEPGGETASLEIMSAYEKEAVLYGFNNTGAGYPAHKTVPVLFEESARRVGDTIALAGPAVQLTYSELNQKSDLLASVLLHKGVVPNMVVGVMLKPSVEMIIGILGILKSGGAYLPIDVTYPTDRKRHMILDSAARIVVAGQSAGSVGIDECDVISIEDINTFEGDCKKPAGFAGPNDMIYVIFTSGSTGRPKGAGVYHRGFMNLVYWYITEFGLNGGDGTLLITSLSFDLTQKNIFAPLMVGGRLLIPPVDYFEPREVLQTVLKKSITWINCTPGMFYKLVEEEEDIYKLSSLRYVFLGGEPISPALLSNWFSTGVSRAEIINTYGPTECTDVCSYYRFAGESEPPATGGNVPIGRPVYNTRLYILDRNLRPVPIGVGGELCISGSGVGLGYINYGEKTSEKFVSVSFENGDPVPVYRTGDLARWLWDGSIAFIGRIDSQVKVRGFRIELGEIENRLSSHGAVKEAALKAHGEDDGNRTLCAYIVLSEAGGTFKAGDLAPELRKYLSHSLPDYMIPSYFMEIERLPLTSNGKVDRNALPEPRITAGKSYTPPRDDRENTLVTIWSELLGIDASHIGIDDNFFQLGGHSLKAVTLTGRIHKTFDIELPMGQLFDAPTIRGIRTYMDRTGKRPFRALEPVEEKEYYPLSPAQKRMYVLHQREGESTVYNINGGLVLEGEIEIDKFEFIFLELINRHESLRTSFIMVNGEPVQRINRHVDFEIEYFFSTPYPLPLTPHFLRSFDLSCAPLLRVGLEKSGDNTHLLLFDMHHIVSDGMSMEFFIKEFTALYRGEVLPPLRIRYRDYSSWCQAGSDAGNYNGQAAYWREQFRGEVPVLELPVDFARPPVQSFKGGLVRFEVFPGETRRLKALALKNGTTIYNVLLAVYNVFLSKIGNRETVIVGTPAAGRRHAGLEAVFGLFINTLALKNNPGGGKTFTGFLEEVGKHTLDAFENQDYPFEELLESLKIYRDPGRHPLFDTMFALRNVDISAIRIPGLKTRPYEFDTGAAHFDLLLQAMESEETIRFTFEYGSDVFEEATIYRFIDFYKRVVSAVLERPTIKLMEIEIISHEEKELLLREFNDTAADYPRDKSIHRLFEEEVEKHPDHAAVVFEDRVISYGELDRRAGVFAADLQGKGLRPGKPVAIMPTVSLEMILGVLGILKAGGAYVPMDPDYPEDRIRYILKDSKAQKISFEEHKSRFAVSINISPANLAYIIYTSGSTGRPRGVLVEHRNVVRLVKNTDYIEFKGGDRLLQTGALSFDASTFEIWGALLNGLTLYLAKRDDILSPPALKILVENYRITTMWMTSPLFNRMVESDVEIFMGLRNLLVGGDVLSPIHINRVRGVFPRLRVINGYGPTENTTFSTTYSIDSNFERSIPIGRPIANSTAYILNNAGGVQPIGIYGELWVGGDGVARGYLNNPELTAERFNRSYKTYRSYKTGDLARWLPNGTIEFLGRLDQQVKIRGFRIEPGEIEGRLLRHPGVNGAVVLPKGGVGDKQLCAYIASGGTLSVPGIKKFLSAALPDYMVPAFFVFLDSIPLTANGKVDWRALPEPEAGGGTQLIAPREESERKLVEIWSDVLGIENHRIGINSDFFELGGHSIKAALLVSEIFKAFDVNLSLTTIFTMPTVRELSAFIKGAVNVKYVPMEPAEEREYYPLSSAQKRLYFLQQITGDSTVYNITESLELKGELDKKRLEATFPTLIRRHESFRTSFHRVHDEPVQKIHDSVEFKIEYFHSTPQLVRPFDLSQAPLVRVGLIKRGEADHLLIVDMHHIISDGTSVEIVVREFTALYSGRDIPPLTVHYKEYVMWRRELTESGASALQREYWLKEFSGEITVLDLPVDFMRPAVQGFEGRTLGFTVGTGETRALTKTGLEEGATMFMVLQAVTHIFLSKLSGLEDIVVGTPTVGRGHPDTEPVIGMFVNMAAIRSYPTGEKTFLEYLTEIKEKSLSAYENRDYPYEDLVDELGVKRDAGRNPLFDVAFALQEPGIKHMRLPGLKLKLHELETGISKFDLTVFAILSEGKLNLRLEYCTALFEEPTIHRFTGYFKRVVSSVVKNPVGPLGDIEIISEREKKQVLYDFNRRDTRYSNRKTLHGLFEEQVEKTPDTIALLIRETREKHENEYSLSYKRLNEKAGQLAVYLGQRGVGENSLVGLETRRSLEMIIGILGILKAGCGYVPLNPGAPDSRTGYMLRECGVSMLLTTQLIKDAEMGGTTVTVSPSVYQNPRGIAYVIFTSGSSGKPKGVPITHANISPLLHWGYRHLGLGTGDRVIQNLSYYFDWSVWEIFLTLTTGAGLHLVADDILLNPVSCIDFMDRNRITVLHITPGQYRYLVNTGKKTGDLNYLFIGAETFSVDLAECSLGLTSEDCRVFNMYGPTEATIIAAVLEIDRNTYKEFKRLTSVPIGKPVANLDLFILDKYRKVCPVNIPGELFITGDGVARGYLNNPEMTNSKFQISNHNPPAGGASFFTPYYHTGDRGRWLPGGSIEFLGRLDQQVKIRGYRVELGEIECRMMALKGIEDVLVTARTDEKGDNYLCAYMRTAPGKTVAVPELREWLSGELPVYMIPSYFLSLETFPVTSTGKVDRRKLPGPEGIRPELGAAYAAPDTDTARAVAAVWREILKVDKVGIHDNFFDLGGSSLHIVRLSSRLKEVLGKEVPIVILFEYPTIHTFSQHFSQHPAQPAPGDAGAVPREEKPLDLSDKLEKGRARMKGRHRRK